MNLRSFVIGGSVLCALLASSSTLSAQAPAEWQTLFDGETLAGWTKRGRGGKALFAVEVGCIVGRTVPKSRNTFLCTERHYGDFELEYEFRIDPELNSGVQIRSGVVDGVVTGYQVEIDPDVKRKRFWTGGIYDENRRGWIADLKEKPEARAAFRPGEWNRIRVLAIGPRIQTWINGVAAADLLDTVTLSGFVGLQVHGVGNRADPLEVRWRNLRIRDLGAHRWRNLLDGASVPAWATGDGWRANGKTLTWKRGQDESAHLIQLPGRYRDFVLRTKFAAESHGARFGFRSPAPSLTTRLGLPVAQWGGVIDDEGRELHPPVGPQPNAEFWTMTAWDSRARWHAGGRRVSRYDALPEGDGDGGLLIFAPHLKGLAFERLERLDPVKIAPTLGRPAPESSILLSAGDSLSTHWKRANGAEPKWRFADGVITVVPGAGSIVTEEEYLDFELHLEFAVPADEGNSGVYLQRRYEVQILNSYGELGANHHCASLYKYRRPDLDVSLPPGAWQSYDIRFRSPRWRDGEKSESARITVVHNGVVVHDNVELTRKTGAGQAEAATPGPILLQDHGSEVRYRNLWIRRLNSD